jgi:hypothetical protein
MANERDIFFLSKNYVSADDTISASSGTLLLPRIYDQKFASQWQSSGETAETGYDTYIEIIFNELTTATDRVIDTIVLQNINLKDFKIQYFTGGAYADIAEAVFTTNAATGLRIKLAASITTSKIKILMKATIVTGQEKKIGEVWAMLESYCLSAILSTRTRRDENLSGLYRFGNGGAAKWFEWNKWGKTYQIKNITDTQLAALEAIFSAHSSFTFYENYTRDINSIHAVLWIGDFAGDDNPKIGVALNSVTLQLVEK